MGNPILAAGEISGGLEALKVVVTFLLGCITDVVSTIVATPLLLIPVGIMVTGASIGLGKRFIGR